MKHLFITVIIMSLVQVSHSQLIDHKSDVQRAIKVFWNSYEAERAFDYNQLENIAFSMQGSITNPLQAYDLESSLPNSKETFIGYWYYDLTGKLFRQFTRELYNGEHDLRWEQLHLVDTSYFISTQMRRYNKVSAKFQSTFQDVILLPGWFLHECKKNLTSISWVGVQKINAESYDVIELEWMDQRRRIWVSQSTGLINRITWVSPDVILGDRQNTIEFVNRIQKDNFSIPQEVNKYLDGHRIFNRSFTEFSTPKSIAEEVFTLEDDLQPHKVAPWSLKRVSDHVYELQGIGGNLYTIPFVVFQDFIAIYDAIISPKLMKRAIQIINENFTAKPIRYVILSHNHTDHINGLSAFKDKDVTILTTKKTIGRVDQLMNAPKSTFDTDSILATPRYEVKVIIEKTPLIIKDGHLTMEIYNTGSSPHVSDLLFALVKSDNVLIQADSYFRFSKWGAAFDFLLSWVEENNLINPTITGVHHMPIRYNDLVEEKEVQRSIIPSYLKTEEIEINGKH